MKQVFCPSHFVRLDRLESEPVACGKNPMCGSVCARTLPGYVMDFKGGPHAPQNPPIPTRDADGELYGKKNPKVRNII